MNIMDIVNTSVTILKVLTVVLVKRVLENIKF